MIEEFFLSRIFFKLSRPPPCLCIRLFGNGVFPRNIPCRFRYRARCVPQHAIWGSFLFSFLFFIEKHAVRVLQESISYLSRTHTVSSYLTHRALFDPIPTTEQTQKNPICHREKYAPKSLKKHEFPARYTFSAPAAIPSALRKPTIEPRKTTILLIK